MLGESESKRTSGWQWNALILWSACGKFLMSNSLLSSSSPLECKVFQRINFLFGVLKVECETFGNRSHFALSECQIKLQVSKSLYNFSSVLFHRADIDKRCNAYI